MSMVCRGPGERGGAEGGGGGGAAVRCSIPACALGIFPGRVIPVTENSSAPSATLSGA